MSKIEAKLTIDNCIYELRNQMGWTQQELADSIGVTRATIIAIEKGSYNPTLELAFKLSKIFKTAIETVFFEKRGHRG